MKTFIHIAIVAVFVIVGYLIYQMRQDNDAMILVNSPRPNALVTSPLRVSGKARGNWYFEASFPIKLLDAEGKQIAIGIGQAQGDWMTTDFVPFEGKLIFQSPTTDTGTIVLQKDNPSGLPEHDAEVRIKVRFR